MTGHLPKSPATNARRDLPEHPERVSGLPRLVRAAAGVLALLATGGCQEADWAGLNWFGQSKPPVQTAGTEPSEENRTPLSDVQLRPIVVQTIGFAIVRVRAAAGTFSQSGKIWNAINEDVLPIETQRMLQNNGLRIGVGSHSAWPQIKAVLDAEKVQVSQDEQVMQNSVPLCIEINRQPRDQTLFLIRSDGTMPGAFFPRSTNVLRIEYWIPPAAPESVLVEVMPEVRLQAPAYGGVAATFRNPPIGAPARPLRELVARVPVGPDEFLAVGPSRGAQQKHLAGSLLLTEEIDGRVLESMCFITPKILAVPKPAFP